MSVWDIGTIIAGAAMVVVLVTHHLRQRKREKDFEKNLKQANKQ